MVFGSILRACRRAGRVPIVHVAPIEHMPMPAVYGKAKWWLELMSPVNYPTEESRQTEIVRCIEERETKIKELENCIAKIERDLTTLKDAL